MDHHVLRGMPVSDALVSFVQQFIVRHIMFLNIFPHLLKAPVCQWVDFDQPGLVHFDDVQISSLASLASPSSRQHSFNLQLGIGSLGGLDLGHPIIQLIVGLPQTLTVLGSEFLGSLKTLWLVDVHRDIRVTSLHPINERERLGEMMQRIEEDEIDVVVPVRRRQLGEHVQGH